MTTTANKQPLAMGLIFLSVLASVTIDSMTKYAGQSLGTWQLLFLRWLFGLLFYLPIALSNLQAVRWIRPRTHLIRLLISVVACFCLYFSLTHLPLATCVTIFFAEPLFMLPLAAVLLKEKVSTPDWLASAAGFAGVVIIARPGPAGLNPVVLVAALGSLAFAAMHVMNKPWSRTESTRAMMFWMAVMMTLCTLPFGLLQWHRPSWSLLGLVALMAFCGLLYGAAWITAAKIGNVSRVASLSYLALPLSYLVGWKFFNEPVKPAVVAGSAVILIAVAAAGRRNLRPSAESTGTVTGEEAE